MPTPFDSARRVIVVPVSFETGRLGTYRVQLPFACEIVKITSRVTQALGATNPGTIQGATAQGNSVGGLITHAASAPFGDEQVAFPSTNRKAVGYYDLVTAKTTAGGQALVTLEIVRRHG